MFLNYLIEVAKTHLFFLQMDLDEKILENTKQGYHKFLRLHFYKSYLF